MNVKDKDLRFEVTLKNDYLFKRLLGVEENKHILQDFLECVLDISHKEIDGIELLDKELKKDVQNEKSGVLDVKVRLKTKAVVDVEIQGFWTRAYTERTLFYWSKMYIEDFEEGNKYSHLHKCITINIVGRGFNLNELVHSKYVLKEEGTNKKLTDIMELHFLNLERARKMVNADDKMIRWLQFIDTNDREVREMLAKTSPVLKILNEKVNVLSLTPDEKRLYESRMKLKSDIATYSEAEFNRGREEGKEEGREEGEKKAKMAMAKMMKNKNFDISTIMEMTGLTQEEIEKI